MTDDFLSWLRRISDGDPNVRFAQIAGVDKSTVGRWTEKPPSPDSVRALAIHYGHPVIEGMIAAGHMTQEDATAQMRTGTLRDYSPRELLRELERRIDEMSPPPDKISGPEDYGEEPTPDDFELAAGTIAREDDHHAD